MANPSKLTNNTPQPLQDLVQDLSSILLNATALEVNTLIVQDITPTKFIPHEVYRDLYPISNAYLEKQGVSPTLRSRYLNLRRKMELEYALLLSDPNSQFYQPELATHLKQQLPILTNSNLELDKIQTQLPPPEEIEKVEKLLKNSKFLRTIRLLQDTKQVLDYQHKKLTSGNTDVLEQNQLFAQTTIHLEGNIINRYAEEILTHPQRDLILQLHSHSVEAGQQQWRRLFSFMLDMIKRFLNY